MEIKGKADRSSFNQTTEVKSNGRHLLSGWRRYCFAIASKSHGINC
jgi:hypothetical protein